MFGLHYYFSYLCIVNQKEQRAFTMRDELTLVFNH